MCYFSLTSQADFGKNEVPLDLSVNKRTLSSDAALSLC